MKIADAVDPDDLNGDDPNGNAPNGEEPGGDNGGESDEERAKERARRLDPSDLRLWLRILGYLRRYKMAVVLALVFMIVESVTTVFSIGLFKPVLEVVFEKKITGFERQAREFALTVDLDPDGTPRLSGYLFLPAQADKALAAAKAHGSIVVGEMAFVGSDSWERLIDGFEGTIATGGPGRPAIGTFGPGAGDLSLVKRLGIRAMAWCGEFVWSLEQRALNDESFAFTLLKGAMFAFMALTMVRVIAAFLASFCSKRIGFLAVRDMRDEVYSHMLGLDFAFFARRATGDLMSVVTTDIATLQQIITALFSRFLQVPLEFVITLAALLIINVKLTLICLGGVVPLATVVLALSRKVRKSSRRVQENRAELNHVLQETFTGIRTVMAYGMEEHESRKFAARNQRLYRHQLRQAAYAEAASQINEVVLSLLIVGIISLGGYFVLRLQAIEPATFITFLLLMINLFRPFRAWSKALVKIQSGLAGAERLFRVLDSRSEIRERPGAATYDGRDTTVEWRGVTFGYTGEEPVVHGIELRADPGRVLALVGHAGSGKSTLINLIPRFYDVQKGEVRVGGGDVRDYTIASLRAQIAIVSQHLVIFDDTIRSNIAYGHSEISDAEIEAAARAANIHAEIMAMPHGYATRVGGGGLRLSGGQRQRVAIARAILKDAPILILDEATAALDVENEKMIQESLERLMKGRTVIVIAHRLSTIRNADLICVLDEGRIIERGTHRELLELGGQYATFHRIATHERPAAGAAHSDEFLLP